MGNKSSSSKQSGGAGGGAGAGMTKKKKRGKAMKLSSKQVQQKLDTAAKLGSLSLANAGLSKLPPALWELHKVGCMVFIHLFAWCNSHELTGAYFWCAVACVGCVIQQAACAAKRLV